MQIENWINTELAKNIWTNKYQYKGETFDEWLNRISNGNENIKQLIIEKKFLFGGRILANRGLHKKGVRVTYSNCYVIPKVEDNIESIFDTAKLLARTFSYGGGCGVDITNLRPTNATVNNTARNTTGSVSFMDLYSLTTELIGQHGRRGALMLSILCTHPDLIRFIDVKNDLTKVTKANISIRILDEFMEAVKQDKEWVLHFYVPETDENIVETHKAKDLFNLMAKNNWNMAEPGMLFWDTICNWNLLSEDDEFEFAGTNPCAEEPLPAGGSCLLGSINLAEFVINPYKGNDAKFDYVGFKYAVEQSVIALNEVLDEGLPLHPLQIQRDSVRDWRQIGLGVMGIGDMLIKLGIKYGSEDSLDICDKIGFEMADTAINTSSLLAKEYGVYPNFKLDKILKSPYLIANTNRETLDNIKKYGLRNSQLLTIAPTGSLSTMIGISGGIEPLFAISYFRTTKSLHDSDVTYKVYTPIVKDIMDIHSIQEEKDLPDYIVTSMSLNYKDRIDMQSIWQEHIDASISSTVNVQESFTVKEVEDLYMYAWEKKLKGITIYRDNCARFGILTLDKKEEPKDENNKGNPLTKLEWGTTLESSDDLIGKKRKIMSGCGSLHVQAWFDPCDGRLMEIYLSKGSDGGCASFMTSLSRTLSGALRTGMSFDYAIDQLKSTPACPSYSVRTATKRDTSKGNSCPSAVANALIEMQKEINYELGIEETEESILNKIKPTITPKNKVKCPKCGGDLRFEGGCNSCPDCGYSRCD